MTSGTTVVYAGKGSSHSWTWLADLLASVRTRGTRFVDGTSLAGALDDGCRTVVLSGGDAYAMASSLGAEGFGRIREFVDDGGLYVGICAGAYLPLPTSVEPMDGFNLCSTRIENITSLADIEVPDSPRARVGYCGRMIVHPVRGEVVVSIGGSEIAAPLYGGPIFKEPTADECIARYLGTTPRTEFQADPRVALDMLVGRPAAVSSVFGSGRMMLFGPHLEHPSYPSANEAFLQMLGLEPGTRPGRRPESGVPAPLRRAIADLRVAVRGLEGRSFLVGEKMWDAERFMTFVGSIGRHAPGVPPHVSDELAETLAELRARIVSLEPEGSRGIEDTIDSLMAAARMCVDEAFRSSESGR